MSCYLTITSARLRSPEAIPYPTSENRIRVILRTHPRCAIYPHFGPAWGPQGGPNPP